MKEAVVVGERISSFADHCLLVQVVVARGEHQPDEDDHKSPLVMEGEEKVANLDLTGREQFLDLAPQPVNNTE